MTSNHNIFLKREYARGTGKHKIVFADREEIRKDAYETEILISVVGKGAPDYQGFEHLKTTRQATLCLTRSDGKYYISHLIDALTFLAREWGAKAFYVAPATISQDYLKPIKTEESCWVKTAFVEDEGDTVVEVSPSAMACALGAWPNWI